MKNDDDPSQPGYLLKGCWRGFWGNIALLIVLALLIRQAGGWLGWW